MKKKLMPLIISAVLLLAGIAMIVVGIFVNKGEFSVYPELDLLELSDEDVGKTFTNKQNAEWIGAQSIGKKTNYIMQIWEGADAEAPDRQIIIYFDVPRNAGDKFEEDLEGLVPICGTVRESTPEINETMESLIRMGYEEELAYYEQEGIEYDETMFDEAALEQEIELISPYYIEIMAASSGNIYIWIGRVIIAVAVLTLIVTLLTALLGKRFLIVFGIIAGFFVIILPIVLMNKLRTMASVTEVSDGLYTMTCHYDYKCDKFLNADISTIDELMEWVSKEHFFGVPIELDESNIGCAAFTAGTPDGQRLFCRNFDYPKTDTLVVYTEPKDGYASYGVVDLTFFDIGKECAIDVDSLPAKALMLCAPYTVMDGINEAGIGVGILQLEIDEVHQDGGRSDLLISSAIRGILDKCATVDEALDFMENYDMHSCLDCSYHLFITDKTGRSVIVEWTDNETFIVEDAACTNDVMSENEFYDPEWSCKRYDIIKSALADKNGILTQDEAMTVAGDARRKDTQWSCVYNLDEFTLDICLDKDYETKHSFTKDHFK